MTHAERRLFAVASETVSKLSELSRQDWWLGWIAYLDQVRVRMPETLVPKRSRRWPWMRPPVEVIDFNAAARKRARRRP